jgi:hypothetical protein
MTTRYFYLRDNNNRQPRANGKITRGNPIAILISEVNRMNNTISYAFAVAHPQDSFNKNLGRRIVSARLEDPKKSFVIQGVPAGCHEITRVIMNDIIYKASYPELCGHGLVPHRVRDAAAAWLLDAVLTIPAPAINDGVEVVIPAAPVPTIRA